MLPYMARLRSEYRHERLTTTGTSSVNWLGNLSLMHVLVGEFEPAREAVEESGQIAEETGKPFHRAMAGWWHGQMLVVAGRPVDAVARLESTIALTEEHGMHYLGQWARKGLGAAYVELGEAERGRELRERAIHDANGLGVVLCSTWGLGDLAHAANERGDFRAAVGHAESARSAARRAGSRWMEGLALQRLARALALAEDGREDLAERNWLAAVSIFEQCEAHPLIAHCERELGAFYITGGREHEARMRLSAALSRYRRFGVRSWVASTERLLSSLPYC